MNIYPRPPRESLRLFEALVLALGEPHQEVQRRLDTSLFCLPKAPGDPFGHEPPLGRGREQRLVESAHGVKGAARAEYKAPAGKACSAKESDQQRRSHFGVAR